MTRLLLPLDHHAECADPAELALLHRLKKLPRRVQQVFLLNRLDQLSYADIARRLDLSVRTVETHRQNIKRKLALDTPAELLRYALEHARGLEADSGR